MQSHALCVTGQTSAASFRTLITLAHPATLNTERACLRIGAVPSPRSVGYARAAASPLPGGHTLRNCPNLHRVCAMRVSAVFPVSFRSSGLPVCPLPLHHHRTKPPRRNSCRRRCASRHNPCMPSGGLLESRLLRFPHAEPPEKSRFRRSVTAAMPACDPLNPASQHASRERGMPSA